MLYRITGLEITPTIMVSTWIALEREWMKRKFGILFVRCLMTKPQGLDGFPIEFYKSYWEVIKGPYIHFLKDFLSTLEWKHNAHEGVISLIPKKGNLSRKVEDFRPITLLNVSYKIFTKLMASRLGKVINSIMHRNQFGFIPGRNIFDNFFNV